MEILSILVIIVVVCLVLSGDLTKPHEHVGFLWDGYHEVCRCGASAGDKKDRWTGKRYTFFSEWPK